MMTNQVSILTNKIKKLNADRDPRRCAQVTIGQPTLSSQGQLICHLSIGHTILPPFGIIKKQEQQDGYKQSR